VASADYETLGRLPIRTIRKALFNCGYGFLNVLEFFCLIARTMNVLFYTDTPGFGGTEKHMITLAKTLSKKGIRVTLACGSYSGILKHSETLKSVFSEILVIPSFGKHDPRHFFGLKRILKQHSFDLVHLHLWNPASCRYAFLALRNSKIPIVVTEHDYFELSSFKRRYQSWCLQQVSRIILLNSAQLHAFQRHFPNYASQSELVFNGIDPTPFIDVQPAQDSFFKKENTVITCIAEMHERKGHAYLIEAYKNLKVRFPNLHLCLVSDGPNRQGLEKQAMGTPDIHFLGWRDDISSILKASQILILPSLRESFGLVLIEAMLSHVPVIASSTDGPSEIIQHHETGLLCPIADAKGLESTIEELLSNPEFSNRMRDAAYQMASKKFTDEVMADHVQNLYEKIIK